MNKFIRCFLGVGLSCLSLCSFAQIPIYITAKVIEKSCEIVNDDIIVDMYSPEVKGVQVNQIFAQRPFVIELENCPSEGTLATVKFSTEQGVSPHVENNSTVSPAVGYSIVIYDKTSHAIDMRDNQTSFNIAPNVNGDKVKLGFTAYFIKTSANASPGNFTGVASFEISYE